MSTAPDHTAAHADTGMSGRSEELLNGILRYIRLHGVEQFSLATVADFLGTSSRMLIYHLGSRDEILIKATSLRRMTTSAFLRERPVTGLAESARRMWEHYLNNLWEMQLFFFVSTRAFAQPVAYARFARDSRDVWMEYLTDGCAKDGINYESAVPVAGLCLAGLRGLFLDLLLTGDRERAESSFIVLVEQLESARVSRFKNPEYPVNENGSISTAARRS
ncbi:TetR/AcrR family transcriptional regulator [Nakamurella antarctica]|uniref:TetR/AcrR family transcriptional regulator n=1 Tax=Nakamurella antarctica TaxID=1902245 RepID=A0A3G8ZK07_9ACTN|nr:TetR/AcrR family transcriptional regulator [Nakamurella antarctica]AZI57540.1 TetR/AcrR family transcriptional regulator [Nakamurella antarctica]